VRAYDTEERRMRRKCVVFQRMKVAMAVILDSRGNEEDRKQGDGP
jgi:hypothetical protein